MSAPDEPAPDISPYLLNSTAVDVPTPAVIEALADRMEQSAAVGYPVEPAPPLGRPEEPLGH